MLTMHTLLDVLQDAPFKFHLTGSRFFGNARSDSNWNFYAQDSLDIRSFLESAGFEEGDDRNRMRQWDDVLLADVEVLLVEDVALQTRVQQAVYESGVLNSKRDAASYWRFAEFIFQEYT